MRSGSSASSEHASAAARARAGVGRRDGAGRRDGFLMPVAMAVLVAATVLGFAALSLGYREETLANREADGCKAFFLAEAGVQRALYELAIADSWAGVPAQLALDEPLGDGTYSVHITTSGATSAIIVSEGKVNGRPRQVTVEVQRT